MFSIFTETVAQWHPLKLNLVNCATTAGQKRKRCVNTDGSERQKEALFTQRYDYLLPDVCTA
jgi:hypothetical protein